MLRGGQEDRSSSITNTREPVLQENLQVPVWWEGVAALMTQPALHIAGCECDGVRQAPSSARLLAVSPSSAADQRGQPLPGAWLGNLQRAACVLLDYSAFLTPRHLLCLAGQWEEILLSVTQTPGAVRRLTRRGPCAVDALKCQRSHQRWEFYITHSALFAGSSSGPCPRACAQAVAQGLGRGSQPVLTLLPPQQQQQHLQCAAPLVHCGTQLRQMVG